MDNRREFLKKTLGIPAALLLSNQLCAEAKQHSNTRPNILWIITEDLSCDFGYQGQSLIKTPTVDKLAKEGAVFANAYVTAPICSPSRSALITGMYQTTIGAHHHVSSRGPVKIHLPPNIRLIPELFQEAGYYTCNCGYSGQSGVDYNQYGKADYNFEFCGNKELYNAPDWSGRKEGQPFFAQIQLRGGKLRDFASRSDWYEEVKAGIENPVNAGQVTLPPYYPDHSTFQQDWAEYLNCVQYTDKEVGIVLARLKNEGLLDNTVIFFIADHGISSARGKGFLYEDGTHVPFIVWAPGKVKAQVRTDLIAHIDMAATSLYFAGIDIPAYMEARPLFGPKAKPRNYVVSARDRFDETQDRIRSVRKGKLTYIRNFHPERPYLQPNAYKDNKEIVKSLRQLYRENRLNRDQSLLMADTRPQEELYDRGKDPWEIHNLADDPTYQKKLVELRDILNEWIKQTGDKGQFQEPQEMYDCEMKIYVDYKKKHGDTEYAQDIERNISITEQWRAEGK